MDISKIPTGKNPPDDFNVIIEIPQGGAPVKYEMDNESGAMFVDRFLNTAMFYPANYGFIPGTLSDDGDPADCMVVVPVQVVAGCVIRCRPVGALLMEDESGMDEKILAVPVEKLHSMYGNVQTYQDLPEHLLNQIEHFFSHYKDLDPKKWVKISGWKGPDEAKQLIRESIERANKGHT